MRSNSINLCSGIFASTNHLDLESITALNNALINFPGNVIFTSHDHQLGETVANRIIQISPNGMIDQLKKPDEYLGDEKIVELVKELHSDKALVTC